MVCRELLTSAVPLSNGDTALSGDDFVQADVEVGAIGADIVHIGAATGQRQQHRRTLLHLPQASTIIGL